MESTQYRLDVLAEIRANVATDIRRCESLTGRDALAIAAMLGDLRAILAELDEAAAGLSGRSKVVSISQHQRRAV